jgi:hypothetical protein
LINLPAVLRDVRVGSVLTYSCAYSADDLEVFNELSGRSPDEAAGFVPDLLTLAPLTKIGGDLNYIAQRMVWTAHRRVLVGERLEAQLVVQRLEERESGVKVAFTAQIIGEAGDVVVHGESKGIVAKA